jgi:hypothetical protein
LVTRNFYDNELKNINNQEHLKQLKSFVEKSVFPNLYKMLHLVLLEGRVWGCEGQSPPQVLPILNMLGLKPTLILGSSYAYAAELFWTVDFGMYLNSL